MVALIDTLEDVNLSANSERVLKLRYLKRDDKGKHIETPKQCFYRVARNIAEVDLMYDPNVDVDEVTREFYGVMQRGEFLPGSPTIMNAARALQQLAACFVLPVEDDMGTSGVNTGSITDSWKNAPIIHKSGGGTGFSYRRLRPKGDIVSTTHGYASGPLSYMGVVDSATDAVNQGGFRRGANMGIQEYIHPDIAQFILAKKEPNAFSNFNLSVAVDEAFMEAVEKKGYIHPINPRNGKKANISDTFVFARDTIGTLVGDIPNLYVDIDKEKVFADGTEVLYYPECEIETVDGKKVVKKKFVIGRLDKEGCVEFNAETLFNLICERAWARGDPGIIFLDRINKYNPTPALGKIEATNPCGEQPLLPYEACNLGSINLGGFVSFETGNIDYQRLGRTVSTAVHFLDNVIDASRAPMPEIEQMVKGNRKIGLGVMGLADMFIKMKIRYGSDESKKVGDEVMSFISRIGREESRRIAEKKGSFPNWKGSVWDPGYDGDCISIDGYKGPLRNATVTTIAPTGSISIITGVSSGIETLFGVTFESNRSGTQYIQPSAVFEEIGSKQGWLTEENKERVYQKIFKNGGSVRGIDEVPKEWQEIFVTAHELSPKEHLEMQAVFQRRTDNAVSKTVNFPKNATVEQVREVFRYANKLKDIKGVTVYRDGSIEGQVINFGGKKKSGLEKLVYPFDKDFFIKPVKVPPIGPEIKIDQPTPWGTMHVHLFYEPKTERVYETYAQIGNSGDEITGQLELFGRLASMLLRSGNSLESVIRQAEGIGSALSKASTSRDGVITSLAQAFGIALRKADLIRETYSFRAIATGEVNPFEVTNNISEMIRAGKKTEDNQNQPAESKTKTNFIKEKCPECGSQSFHREEGCAKCLACGFTQC